MQMKPWFDYLRSAYPRIRSYLDKLADFEEAGVVERLTMSACENLGLLTEFLKHKNSFL